MPAEERNWWAGGLPVTRLAVKVGVPGLYYVSVFVQFFTLAGTAFGQVPGVSPPKIVGFHPWLRLKARWASYDKGFWSRSASLIVFWMGGVGLQLGEIGSVTVNLAEFRRLMRTLIIRGWSTHRRVVDVFTGPGPRIGQFVSAALRAFGRVLPSWLRSWFERLAERRAEWADRQQARHAHTMLELNKAEARRQKRQLADVEKDLETARGAQLEELQRTRDKLLAGKRTTTGRIARITRQRFDRHRLARLHRMMTHTNAAITRLERKGRAVSPYLVDRKREIETQLDEIAQKPFAPTPSWSTRLRTAIKAAWKRLRWTVVMVAAVVVVVAVILLLSGTAGAVPVVGSGAVAGSDAGVCIVTAGTVLAGAAAALARTGWGGVRGWLGRVGARGPPLVLRVAVVAGAIVAVQVVGATPAWGAPSGGTWVPDVV
ncbi:MAG: hypothetical protein ACRDXB_06970, partial [Actinomycetes bacterium]